MGKLVIVKTSRILLTVLFGMIVIGAISGHYFRATTQRARVTATRQRAKRKIAKQDAKLTHAVNQSTFSKQRDPQAQITQTLKTSHFVGTALVVKNDRVVYQRGFGYANQAQGRLNTPASKYQILSIQKSITAVGIMQLVQAGKIKLSDPISKYYPTIPYGQQRTIRQMLDMVSGFRLVNGSTQRLSEKDVVNYALEHLKYRENKVGIFNYQPVNYVLLAGIIRKETGQSYQQFFKRQIIQKLGLKHSGFVSAGMGKGATRGYTPTDTTQVKADYAKLMPETKAQMANELGTGQVYMSAGDLFKVESAILKGKLISKANVRILHTFTATGEYGGGVYNISRGIRSHGVGYGYESDVHLTTNGKTGVVLLTNYRRPAASIEIAANKIFSELLNGDIK